MADIERTNARFAVVDLVNGQLQKTTHFSVVEHAVFAGQQSIFFAQTGIKAANGQSVHKMPVWRLPACWRRRRGTAISILPNNAWQVDTADLANYLGDILFLSLTILPPLGTHFRH